MVKVKFKVGDKVRVIKDSDNNIEVGDILIIENIYENILDFEDCKYDLYDREVELYTTKTSLQNRKIFIGGGVVSTDVQEKLFELGCKWRTTGAKVYDSRGFVFIKSNLDMVMGHIYDLDGFLWHDFKELTLTELFEMQPDKETRTIVLDGKEIELSKESFEAFKEQFSEED